MRVGGVIERALMKAGRLLLSSPNLVHTHWMVQSSPQSFISDKAELNTFLDLRKKSRVIVGINEMDPLRVAQLMKVMKLVSALADGDYIELGTHRGGTARIIWELMNPDRKLFCFDTYEGFLDSDLAIEHDLYKNEWHRESIKPLDVEAVRQNITDGKPANLLFLVAGRVPESLHGYEGNRWRFAHLDMDLYEPTRAALDWLWPRMVPGSVTVCHDYGCNEFPGVKKAVDDFVEPLGLAPLPMGDRWGSAMILKPKAHG